MRISDWSSDVCSSDLLDAGGTAEFAGGGSEIATLDDLPAGLPVQPGQLVEAERVEDEFAGVAEHVVQAERVRLQQADRVQLVVGGIGTLVPGETGDPVRRRSEEHTSELQSLMRN